jgi:hypothetical protein
MFCAITAWRVPACDAMLVAIWNKFIFSSIGASPSIGFNQGLTPNPLEIVFRRVLENPKNASP